MWFLPKCDNIEVVDALDYRRTVALVSKKQLLEKEKERTQLFANTYQKALDYAIMAGIS